MKFNRGSSPRIQVFFKDNINGQSRNCASSLIRSGNTSKEGVLSRGCVRKYFDLYTIEHIHKREEISCATTNSFATIFISNTLLS